MEAPIKNPNPLTGLDEWEEDVLRRYPDADTIATAKSTEEFRNYEHRSGILFVNFTG